MELIDLEKARSLARALHEDGLVIASRTVIGLIVEVKRLQEIEEERWSVVAMRNAALNERDNLRDSITWLLTAAKSVIAYEGEDGEVYCSVCGFVEDFCDCGDTMARLRQVVADTE